MSRASPASMCVAENLLKGLPVGWRLSSSPYGTASVLLDAQDACLEVVLWSTKDPVPTKPGTVDSLQVELVARLKPIEDFLVRHFGKLFQNEREKTIGLFLHRLVPEGPRYAAGFDVTISAGGSHPSAEFLVRLILGHGLPFLESVRSTDALQDGEGITPRLVDPANWEVRRAVAIISKSRDAPLDAILADAETRLVAGLNDKFMAMASAVSALDPKAEIAIRLERFQIFRERMLVRPELVAEVRQFASIQPHMDAVGNFGTRSKAQ